MTNPPRERSRREQILHTSISLTTGDRNKSYGDPAINLACAGELKAVFRRWNALGGRAIGPGEQEALDQVMTKLGRAATGAEPKEDTYVDGAAYFAIAGECALAQDEKKEDETKAMAKELIPVSFYKGEVAFADLQNKNGPAVKMVSE